MSEPSVTELPSGLVTWTAAQQAFPLPAEIRKIPCVATGCADGVQSQAWTALLQSLKNKVAAGHCEGLIETMGCSLFGDMAK
jgi:hypothetical protein